MSSLTPRLGLDHYQTESLPILKQPWWKHLPDNFYQLPDEFDATQDTQWRIRSTAAIDTVTRTAVATAAGAAALPSLFLPSRYKQEADNARYYRRFLDESDPNVFFAPPRKQVKIRRQPVSRYHFYPQDGSAHILFFDSPFEPVNPAMRKPYLRHQRNRTAWAQYWHHHDEPRPTLIMIHGFIADPYWLNTRFLALPWFYKQGFNVLLYTLPFHGRRKGRLAPFSGAQFFSQGMTFLNETFAHAIHDLRLFMNYLREVEKTPAIGATGISLGGYTSALLSSLEDDLAFAIPNVPLTSLMDLIAGWFPVNLQVKLLEKALGLDMAGIRELTALHSPLTWPTRLPKDRLMIIGGAGDRFAPPKHSHLLWQHWNECALHWFPGNHLLHLDQGHYLKEMRDFMFGALNAQGISSRPLR